MKRHLRILLAALLVLATLTACGGHTHEFSSWSVAKNATCAEEGATERSCACGEKETAPIPVLQHTYTEEFVAKPATCVEEGLLARTCSGCNNITSSPLPKTEHTYTDAVTKTASCIAEGEKTQTCSICNHTITTTIPRTDHAWKSASCTAPQTCTVCGTTSGSASGHQYKAATCSAPETCTGCGATRGSALSHNYGSSGKCSYCGQAMVSITLKIPSVGTQNAYASLVVTNYTNAPISFPAYLSFNGKLCNFSGGYEVAAGHSATLTYYRAILPSDRYNSKNYDMYLDNNSIGYCVITWNGTQYYAEYGVNGLTTFYRGNVNGPA